MDATTSCGGSGAGAFHRRTDHVEALRQIGPIQFVAFEAITAGAIDQVGAGELAIIRSGIGIMIIGCDDDQRHVLNRGDIQTLMAGAGLHSAFSNCR